MCGRVFFFSLILVGLAACADEEAASPVPQDDLGTGATAGPGGKADGNDQVVFSSAMTVGPLLYKDFEGEDEVEREGDALKSIFAERISPGGAEAEPWQYLRKMSAVGYYGPLGPYGPLGLLGPTGGNPWNPDLYVTGSFGWSDWSAELTESGGPLSADGPLGHTGPLNEDLWKANEEAQSFGEAFVKHLRPGGVFAVLGPVGVSGALGPLGPLGPIGAHGYIRTEGGAYAPEDDALCHNAPEGFEEPPCRVLEVDYDDTTGERRVYELVERYDEDFAAKMEDNDTSFMVEGLIRDPKDDPDTYRFTSRRDQWVTMVVVPEFAKFPFIQAMGILGQAATLGFQIPGSVFVPHILTGVPVGYSYDHRAAFDDFDLQVRLSQGGKEIGEIISQSGDVVDWVHVKVPAGTAFEATVTLFRAWDANPFIDSFWGLGFRPSTPQYRLIVVGSTEHGQGKVTFSGPYLQSLTD